MNRPDEPDWGDRRQRRTHHRPSFPSRQYAAALRRPKIITLLRYDNPDDIPDGHFLDSSSFTVRYDFTSSGGSHTVNIPYTKENPIRRSGTYFFRRVKNTNPGLFGQGRKTSEPETLPGYGTNDDRFANMEGQMTAVDSTCTTPGIISTSGIHCVANSKTGKIHGRWAWNFLNSNPPVCTVATFTPTTEVKGNPSFPVCMFFDVSDTKNIFKAGDAQGFVDHAGKIYVDTNMSWQGCTYEVGRSGEVRHMMSEDGITRSTLTPI